MISRRVGRQFLRIGGWWDEYATFCCDIDGKRNAGVDVALEIQEGRQLLAQAEKRARGPARAVLAAALRCFAAETGDAGIDILLAPDLRQAMAETEERRFRSRHPTTFTIEIERPHARLGSWYELFPLSP